MSTEATAERGPTTTTDDVLASIDLNGRTAVVTGASSGIGAETARALAAAGAHVVLAVRDVATGRLVADAIRAEHPEATTEVVALDLTDLASVRACATVIADQLDALDLLVNNAGVMGTEFGRTVDGFEMQFGTNHLGHFLLTNLLRPLLDASPAPRVVNLSSAGHGVSDIIWDDPNYHDRPYDKWESYGQSKTANILFTVELDRRYADQGIRAFAAHPGVIIGPGPHDASQIASYREQGLVDDHGVTVIDPEVGKKTVEQGAATLVFGAASPLLDGVGGVYLKDSDVAVIDDRVLPLTADRIPSDANSAMLDADDARRLWEVSEGLLV